MKSELKRFGTVTYYTFVEIYKSRVLLNVVVLGLALLLICYVASEFTFGVPERVALDFGLGLLSLSGVGIAIFMGANLLFREIENRTVYMVLSRPISRYSFMLGKVAGLGIILFFNIGILSILTLVFYLILGGQVNSLICWVMFFSFIESLIMLMVVIIFSLITNVVRAVIFSLAVFVGGHSITDPSILPFLKNSTLIPFLLKVYSYIFPDFSKINFKMFVIYEQSISTPMLAKSLLYSVIYLVALSMLASYLFNRRDLN